MRFNENIYLWYYFKDQNQVENFFFADVLRLITGDLKLVARFMNEFDAFRVLPMPVKVIFQIENSFYV